MQASVLRLDQRLIDGHGMSTSKQPWLNIIYLSKPFWGDFWVAKVPQVDHSLRFGYLAPPPVKAGSSTVTDQSTLLDSITR
jgi:hypothetical protein